MTTTKRIFAVTSPTTGEVFTRKSERDYTFAVIYLATGQREEEYVGGIREAVTFHHTEALANKAATDKTCKHYDKVTVLPCEVLERKPKGSKTAWTC
jgi:hypothetical protein